MEELYKINDYFGENEITANPLELKFDKEKKTLELNDDNNNYIHMYLEALSVIVGRKSEKNKDINYKKILKQIDEYESVLNFIRLQEGKIKTFESMDNENIYYIEYNYLEDTLINQVEIIIDEMLMNGETLKLITDLNKNDNKNIIDLNDYLKSGLKMLDIDEKVKDINSMFNKYKKMLQIQFKESFKEIITIIREIE